MMNATVDLTAEESGGFENAEMFGDGGQGHRKRLSKFFDGGFASGKASEDGAARGVGEGAESMVQSGGRIVNHMVYYRTGEGFCQEGIFW